VDDRIAPARSVPAVGAAAWCAVFAAVHLFWAVGGTAGLASSAGQGLAERRPADFVVFGLFGVAALLLAGIVLVIMANGVSPQPDERCGGVWLRSRVTRGACFPSLVRLWR